MFILLITKEIDAIFTALENGQPTYKLKYCAKVKKTFWSVKLDEYGQGTGGGNIFIQR